MKWYLFLPYASIGAVATVLILLVYASVQQSYRQGADDPQVQLAYELNNRLQRGQSIDRLMPDSIELSESLGVFAAFYGPDLLPLRSSGLLHGQLPRIPSGVLDYVKTHGQERVSWQPEHQVRMALVVLRSQSPNVAFVVVGRSLMEIEQREANLRTMALLCWVLVMGMLIVIATLAGLSRPKTPR
jgi:hypothetical protein